jgi:toxin ParE1/3/4
VRVRYTQPASGDLDDLLAHVAADNPRAASSIERAIAAVVERLKNFPNLGRIGRAENTREAVIPGLPYILVYTVRADALTILAILHGARDVAGAIESRKTE